MAIPSNTSSTASSSKANRHISKIWLFLLRLFLFALSGLNLILYIVGTPVYFAQLFPNHECFQDCLTPANIQSLHTLGLSVTVYAVYWVIINLLFALSYFTIAALIFWLKSDGWMALLASFSLVALGGSFTDIPTTLASVYPVWRIPVTLVSENVLGFPSFILFFFLFPNGRFVPRWTRWIVVGAAVLYIPGTLFPNSLLNVSLPSLLLIPLSLTIFGSLVFTQVYRYRNVSTSIERQQTKWIVFGVAIGLLGFLLLGVVVPAFVHLFMPLQSISLLPYAILVTSIYLVLLLIPLSLATAILRYRLWDVDVLINRTLVYGLLTSTLVAVYAGSVVGLQVLFRAVFNQTSDLAIVASTLVIAVLFQPLRRLIQARIDRHFFRRKYDATRTLASFNEALRNEVDLAHICEDLVSVVQETMQPAHISLWVRQPQHLQEDDPAKGTYLK